VREKAWGEEETVATMSIDRASETDDAAGGSGQYALIRLFDRFPQIEHPALAFQCWTKWGKGRK
jgi:hypothetical protein